MIKNMGYDVSRSTPSISLSLPELPATMVKIRSGKVHELKLGCSAKTKNILATKPTKQKRKTANILQKIKKYKLIHFEIRMLSSPF